jgi:hypothetical protein
MEISLKTPEKISPRPLSMPRNYLTETGMSPSVNFALPPTELCVPVLDPSFS